MLAFASLHCDAQQDEADVVIKAYQVENAVADEVYQVLASAFSGNDSVRLSADNRTNTLILMANADDHEKAKSIIAEIDRPSKQPEVRVFALAHGNCVNLAETIVRLLGHEETTTRISYDESTNSLIVLGNGNELERIEALIVRLDQPDAESVLGEDCKVRVTWLVDADPLSPEQVEDLGKPRANLQSLIEMLEQESMNDVKSVTACTTRVGLSTEQGAKQFNNSSLRSVGDQDCSMGVGGRIKRSANGNFELEVTVDLVKGQTKLTHASAFSLPGNHPVALSVSDFGDLRSVIVIEVVEE